MRHLESLTPWKGITNSPFRELASLEREMSRLFDNFWSPVSERSWGFRELAPLACDIEERESEYIVCLDMPGIPKDKINVQVEGNLLMVSGEREEERKEKEKSDYFKERSYGRFERTIQLPTTIQTDKIEANYKDGVLTLVLPKEEKAKPKQIEIKEGESSFLGKLLNKEKKEEKKQEKAA